MLPLVAVLDAALAITLGVLILRQEARHIEPDPSLPLPDPALEDAAWERRKIVLAVLAFSFARCSAYLIVGISLRIRQLGVTVAAISILSTLFYVSVANLLFQARSKPSTLSDMLLSLSREWRWPDAFRHFEPTMPILVGAQIGFTLFEWVLYIAVVGVKIPPGGNPVTAKRWQRGLSNDEGYQRGVDAHSLYFSDGEEEREELGDGASQANEDLEQARGSLASPISTQMREAEATEAEASDHPLLGASPHTPRGYGSTLETPRTPQAGGPIQPGASQHQGSVRSNRSVRTQGRNRSASTRSGMYSRSPNAAELVGQALVDDEDDDDGNDGEEEVGDEEDAEGSDPDDIIDITPNRVVARKEARLRLARAEEGPEARFRHSASLALVPTTETPRSGVWRGATMCSRTKRVALSLAISSKIACPRRY